MVRGKMGYCPVGHAVFDSSGRRAMRPWGRFVLCLVVVTGLSAGVGLAQQGAAPVAQAATPRQDLSAAPGAHDSTNSASENAKGQNPEAASTERQKQIADASARLASMAADLKSEVDKATVETLSVSAVRQADAIEKLARDVREKMKRKAGGR